MSHNKSLCLESLESRKLLTAVHHAAAHPAHPAEVAPKLVLTGNLGVDNSNASTVTNSDGSTTTETPVGGTLATLGTVSGVWIESHDSSGNVSGIDTVRLHNSTGAIQVVFNNTNPSKLRRLPRTSDYYYTQKQALINDSGAYAGGSEKGTIMIAVNATETLNINMELTTTRS